MVESRFLYRYVSFEAFVSMIQKKALTLVLPEVWDDPTEKVLFDRVIAQIGDYYTVMLLHMMKWKSFCQCWSKLSESDAMWRLYSFNNMSVRITASECELLELDSGLRIKDVHYTNSELLLPSFFNDENLGDDRVVKEAGQFVLESICRKREAFSHEQEVRMVYPLRWENNQTDLADHVIAYCKYYGADELVNVLLDDPHSIDVNNLSEVKQLLNVDEFKKTTLDISFEKKPNLIRGVMVNPFAPEWFVQTVETYCIDHKLPFEGKSKLYELI